MPVTITTTKEERIAKLVKELRDAGLMLTNMEISSDGYSSNDLMGRRHSFMERRRVTASIEVISDDPEDTYTMLMMWSRNRY